jgi:hypothetical protein
LIGGLEATIQHAGTAMAVSVPRRFTGKQPPRATLEPPSEPARVKYVGKQPAKRVLTDFFTKTPKLCRPSSAPGHTVATSKMETDEDGETL